MTTPERDVAAIRSKRRRGVSIDMGGGDRLCPICGGAYRRGRYKVEHVWASSQHVSELAERRQRRGSR